MSDGEEVLSERYWEPTQNPISRLLRWWFSRTPERLAALDAYLDRQDEAMRIPPDDERCEWDTGLRCVHRKGHSGMCEYRWDDGSFRYVRGINYAPKGEPL